MYRIILINQQIYYNYNAFCIDQSSMIKNKMNATELFLFILFYLYFSHISLMLWHSWPVLSSHHVQGKSRQRLERKQTMLVLSWNSYNFLAHSLSQQHQIFVLVEKLCSCSFKSTTCQYSSALTFSALITHKKSKFQINSEDNCLYVLKVCALICSSQCTASCHYRQVTSMLNSLSA